MNPANPTPHAGRQAGFTLIELLVAIAILGILGGVAIKELWQYIDEAKQQAAKANADTISNQVMMYKRKHNELPRDLETLLEPDPRNNNLPWLSDDKLLDPWGRPYVLIEGERRGLFEIVSYGENGVEDGFEADYGLDMDISSARPLFRVEE